MEKIVALFYVGIHGKKDGYVTANLSILQYFHMEKLKAEKT